jgi:uncharacterized protein
VRALLDVNVLIALIDPNHVHQQAAHRWHQAHVADGWASCAITQLGYVRIISQPKYSNPVPLAQAFETLRLMTARPDHHFWPDTGQLTDAALFAHPRILSWKQLTDIYLLALAVKHGGRLVTFDRSIPLSAVHGATAGNLVVL